MSQNPCKSVHVVIFSPLANSQSSTSPLNCLKRSFISSLAWPTAVRIRSLTEHTAFCEGMSLQPRLGNAHRWKGELTLFRNGLVLHFSLPVDTQARQPVCLTGNFCFEVRDIVLRFCGAGWRGRGFYRGRALGALRLHPIIWHILRPKIQHWSRWKTEAQAVRLKPQHGCSI